MATHVASGGVTADAANAVLSMGTVSSGDLAIIASAGNTTTDYTAGNCTKTAGTSTIGTISLDKADNAAGGDSRVGTWSGILTGSGTLTITVNNSGNYSCTGYSVYSGSWDGTRVEATNSAEFTTSTTPSSGNATSAGAAVFYGVVSFSNSAAVTLTEDTGWTSVYAELDGASHVVGEICRQLVASGTTDAYGTTISAAPNNSVISVVVYKEAGGGGGTTRGTPFGHRGTAFNGGRTFHGIIQ